MGDADRRKKLLNDMFGKIGIDAATIVEWIRDSKMEALLKAMQDIEEKHGAGVCSLLMKEVEIYHPEEYRKYRKMVEDARASVLEFLDRKDVQVKVDPSVQGIKRIDATNENIDLSVLTQEDYDILLSHETSKSDIVHLANRFVKKLNVIDVSAFLADYKLIESGEKELPEGFPNNWPQMLKASFIWPEVRLLAERLIFKVVEEERTDLTMDLIMNNLAKGLYLSAYVNAQKKKESDSESK